MVTVSDVRAVALSLPGTEEHLIREAGKVLLRPPRGRCVQGVAAMMGLASSVSRWAASAEWACLVGLVTPGCQASEDDPVAG